MNLESFGNPNSRQNKTKRSAPAAKFTNTPETREESQDAKTDRCGKGACEVAWKPVPAAAVNPSPAAT
jgi:hypothetical protein